MKTKSNSSGAKYKYLAQNTLLLTLSSFGSKFLSFFLVPLYTNVLTTSEYGTADIITTSAMLLVYIFTINIATSVLRFGIDKEEKPERVFIYGVQIDLTGSLLLLIGLAACYVLNIIKWDWYCYIFLWLVFVADAFESLTNQYLRAIDKVKIMAISSVVATLLRLVANILFLLVFKWGIFGYLISLVIGPAVASIFSLCFILPLKMEAVDSSYEKRLHGEMRKYAIPSMFGQLGWWINNSLDKYFVIWLKGSALNGIYAISYKLPSIMSVICNIFSQAWGISAIKDFNKDDNDKFFEKTYETYNCFLTCCCSVMIFLNVTISRYMFAKDFFVAWKYASLLILAMLFSGLSGFWSAIFNAIKRNEIIAKTTLLSGGINCILNMILIPPFGAMGAAGATLIAFYAVWLMRYILARKYIDCKTNVVKHHVMYILLMLQILFEHLSEHFYFGQIIICVVIFGLNYKVVCGILKMMKTKMINMLRK